MSISSPSSTDPTLLRDVKAHDPIAMEKLVDWVGPLVNHWCGQVKAQDRAEVFQEVFLEVFKSIDKFTDGTGSSFRGWLRTITSSKIVDLIRRQKGQPQAAGGDAAYYQLLEQAVRQVGTDDENDAAVLVKRALNQIRGDFQPNVWQAFLLTAVEGLNSTAAGKELGMNPAAVRQARSRVLARLREVFGDMLI